MAFSNLKNKAQKLNEMGSAAFLEGRDKGDSIPVNRTVLVDNFGFIHGADGKYVALTLKEDNGLFYFGGSVVTKKFLELKSEMTKFDQKFMEDNGIPVLFTQRASKNGNEYMVCEFFPEPAAEEKAKEVAGAAEAEAANF